MTNLYNNSKSFKIREDDRKLRLMYPTMYQDLNSEDNNYSSNPDNDMNDDNKIREPNSEMLIFNGNSLKYTIGGNVVREWPAVSGRSGTQTKEYQYEKDKGPIPEGDWTLGERQDIKSISTIDRFLSSIGRGPWRGLESSWGNHRIWLHPNNNTETKGRTGFSIHGGDNPGSAGCIDLTGNMDDFYDFLKYKSNKIPVKVDYSKK
jgi:hypothetical protein